MFPQGHRAFEQSIPIYLWKFGGIQPHSFLKLEEAASGSAGKQMLEFAIAMYEKSNSGD